MRMIQEDLRLAVLIDADNVPRRNIKQIMDETAVYGTPTVKRIYGDWTTPNLGGWKKPLLEHAITPIQQYGYTTGKNATDSAMIIDAMDLLYSGRVDGFCLVSSDSDFTRLATRLREAGMKVYGLGEKKTPNPFIAACDKFIYIEVISGEKKKAPRVQKAHQNNAEPPNAADMQGNAAAHNNAEPQSNADSPSKGKKICDAATSVPDKIIELIMTTIDDVADEDGWAYLGEVGSLLNKKQPDFDPRNYGCKKLSQIVESIENFEVDFRQNVQANNGKLIYIRNKK